jgi:hypothetical protein
MGHSEMSLAVAGLAEDEIKERTAKLSEGDWSAHHSPAERLAMRFALKLARTPWEVTAKDRRALIEAFGKHRALDVIWRAAWCNYMTRVADAFQFSLEKENVFMPEKRKER